MKFALLIATATAIRLSSKSKVQVQDGPTPADIIDACDASGNGELSKKEAHDCIDEHVPEEHRQEAHQFIDHVWPMVDTNGNGEVDEHELSRAMRAGRNLAQVMDGPSPRQIMDACDGDGSGGISKPEAHTCIDNMVQDPQQRQQMHDMVDATFDQVDKDGSGEVDIHELRQAMRGDRPKRDGPSPRQIMNACDGDGSGGISKPEAHQCIDAMISDDEERKQMHDMIDATFDQVDKDGSGEVDLRELRQAMRGNLAQIANGPTPSDIIDACDASGNGELSKKEAHDCIDEHVPEEHRQEAHQFIDHVWPMVDTNGNGEVDEHELSRAMRAARN